MLIYEVTLHVDADIADAYAEWLAPHIEEVLAVDGFASADWWTVEPDGDDATGGRVRWCVHYRVRSPEALAAYFREHAARLRDEGSRRFGGRFEASRRVLLPHG